MGHDRTPVIAAAVGLALLLIFGACGGGDSGVGTVADAERLLPDPLAVGGASLAGVPLPEGAESATSSADNEAWEVGPPVTFSEVNAFYQREMDGKPFGELAWCGSEFDEVARAVTRTWGGPDSGRHLTLVITARTVNDTTLIAVRDQAGPTRSPCESPSPPAP